jgi:monomeric sarcosine oxidase
MKTDYEYIVIGLGGLGSAAAYWLSRRAGKEVLGLEQFYLGHPNGESQDHSRIIRLSYHTPLYVRFAKEAYSAWHSLEEEANEKLIFKTGGLDLWPRNSIIPISDYTNSLNSEEVPFEILEANEVMRRFPQFRLKDEVTGLYQSEGGIAAAAKCNSTHQRMARAHGATLLQGVEIQSITDAKVITKDQTFSYRKLVIAAGPWSNHVLAQFGLQLPLTITQEQVTYFSALEQPDFMPERFPVWIWMDDPCFYGFPVFGENGVKVGQDVGGKEVTPETRTYDPDPEAFKRVRGFVETCLPGAMGPVLYTKSCLYTLTPDRDFVIDFIPDHPNCLITIGAGHAFKFASVIGRVLSELAMDGETRSDISHFKLTRPVLKEKDPPKNFMT